ncbi:MAG: DUF1254 domain-containing protein [Deltaproteobacteria bacterium]|nr:DUF1254 domain-containing protein [Deltaproteobacteria bacterium]
MGGTSWADGRKAAPTGEQAYQTGMEAYVYAYPLVLMEMTKRVILNRGTPLNRFTHAPMFPPPAWRVVVRPNVDTLYSSAWLDLSREPVILSVPDTGGRYYLLQMLDAWTETFSVPGTRTTGTEAGHFAVAGPGWEGTLPEGVREIKAPTNMVWIIGRTQTNGPSDYANVHTIQNGFKLTPLGDWGKEAAPAAAPPLRPPTPSNTTPPEQVAGMDVAVFFATFVELMKTNPPHDADAPLLVRLQAIGIEAGKDFDADSLPPAIIEELERAVRDAPDLLVSAVMKNRVATNGWSFLVTTGAYGTAYQDRAAVARFGLGALTPKDAIYLQAQADQEGRELTGSSRYVLHFDKGALPPVRAFWSVTMYDPDGFFVPNPINRYAIGDRDRLFFNGDGSLDIYLQHDAPDKEKVSNWLPAPAGSFNLSMRLYWPKPEAADGTWKPPAVRRVE